MNWKSIYEEVLKKICESDAKDYDEIVEVDFSNLIDKLEHNDNTNENSLFSMKLNAKATEEDYKEFCELIYNYIGLDIYDYIKEPKSFQNFKKQ